MKVAPHSGLTVAKLLDLLDDNLKLHFPLPVWIVGEIQNIGKKSNIYFQLAEQQKETRRTLTIDAVIWRNQLNSIKVNRGDDFLQEGVKIRCLCSVNLHRERGSISLHVLDVDSTYTLGQLALERENLLRKIRKQGLENKNKKLKLARLPLKIGLITAENSRAYSDFCHQLEQLAVPAQVFFCPTAMQGEEVLTEVPAAIKNLHACDLIVITRGGGSASDLRWFDMEEVAYSIVHSPVPVVAAIGHHDDLCVSEEICFMRQKTPTAAADYLGKLYTDALSLLEECVDQMIAFLQMRHRQANESFFRGEGEFVFKFC